MPIFSISTNIPKEKIPDDFLKKTATIVANSLGKPISYVVVHVNPDQLLTFGGSPDPCGYASLESIGKIGKDANKKHAAVLYAHIEKELGIPKDRLYINFKDLDKANVGYSGTTFDELM